MDLKMFIRDIPDFPQKGIIFKDITTLLKNPGAFRAAVDLLVGKYRQRKIDKVVAVEGRYLLVPVVWIAPVISIAGAGPGASGLNVRHRCQQGSVDEPTVNDLFDDANSRRVIQLAVGH